MQQTLPLTLLIDLILLYASSIVEAQCSELSMRIKTNVGSQNCRSWSCNFDADFMASVLWHSLVLPSMLLTPTIYLADIFVDF